MLDFIGTIAITALIVVVVNAVINALSAKPMQRLLLAAGTGVWIGLSAAIASSGAYEERGDGALPLIGAIFAAPLIAAAVLAALRPSVRATLLALPMPMLIGLNTARVFGALFLLLAAEGRLGGPFPYSAGWGDVATGVLALPIAWLAVRAASRRDYRTIGVWNAFGALDLVAAVVLGIISASGSPLQLIDVPGGSAAMQHLPWALVPTVLVPFFLIVHGVIFAQLRVRTTQLAARAEWIGAEPA